MNSHDAGPAGAAPGVPPQAGSDPGASAGSGGAAEGGSPEWRRLSFRASGLTMELQITGAGDSRRLMGQLRPRQPAVVLIRHADGVTSVEADALGRFSAESVPLGQISLRCRLGPHADPSPVTTGWITI